MAFQCRHVSTSAHFVEHADIGCIRDLALSQRLLRGLRRERVAGYAVPDEDLIVVAVEVVEAQVFHDTSPLTGTGVKMRSDDLFDTPLNQAEIGDLSPANIGFLAA